jgi:hypothetical protein
MGNSLLQPFLFFSSSFQLSVSSPRSKSCFSKSKKELPSVAFFRQEKLFFFTSGFALHSGLFFFGIKGIFFLLGNKSFLSLPTLLVSILSLSIG